MADACHERVELYSKPRYDGMTCMEKAGGLRQSPLIVISCASCMSACCVRAGLFRLATDPSLSVRRAVCAGLVHMLQLQPGLLAPQMRDVIQYMLESTQVVALTLTVNPCMQRALSRVANLAPQLRCRTSIITCYQLRSCVTHSWMLMFVDHVQAYYSRS